jgi:hypothetical protein
MTLGLALGLAGRLRERTPYQSSALWSSQIAQTCDITDFGHGFTDLWNPHLGSRKITAVRSHTL